MEAKIKTQEEREKQIDCCEAKLLDLRNLLRNFHFIEFENFNIALWYDLNNYCFIIETMKSIKKTTILEIMFKLSSVMTYIINSNPYDKESNLVNSNFLKSRINSILKNYL